MIHGRRSRLYPLNQGEGPGLRLVAHTTNLDDQRSSVPYGQQLEHALLAPTPRSNEGRPDSPGFIG